MLFLTIKVTVEQVISLSTGFNQIVLPAAHKIKDVEKILNSSIEHMVLLGGHIAQMKQIVQLATRAGVKVLLHADLIDGLKNDDYGVDFIIQHISPAGIISTRANVVMKAKQRGLLAILRMFLLDSDALERSYLIAEKTKPDYIEVLPGIIPNVITEVYERTRIPIIAGGLIRTQMEVHQAIGAGAIAVTSSRQELWNLNLSQEE